MSFAPSHLITLLELLGFNIPMLLKLGERKIGGGRPRDAAQVHQHQAQFLLTAHWRIRLTEAEPGLLHCCEGWADSATI